MGKMIISYQSKNNELKNYDSIQLKRLSDKLNQLC